MGILDDIVEDADMTGTARPHVDGGALGTSDGEALDIVVLAGHIKDVGIGIAGLRAIEDHGLARMGLDHDTGVRAASLGQGVGVGVVGAAPHVDRIALAVH